MPVLRLGFGSGVGLVVADMIGAGVFLSAGFMAQDLTPGQILLAWVAGAVIALAGSLAYAAVAERVPRSGGEYRYLSELLHPALGTLAGWASLLVGFSAPIAIDALAAGAFAKTLIPGLPEMGVAMLLVVFLTAAHAVGLSPSKRTQNILVWMKVVLVLGFIGLGLFGGRNQFPTWTPPNPHSGFPWRAFLISLFYVGFAFSGWNAAVYAAGEFRDPKRDVPRSMLVGCALVAVLYLLVNWVFVANLTPDRAKVVFEYESARVTLGHLVAGDIAGRAGAVGMSLLAIVAFLSAMSAMIFLGPRLYSAMAKDGFLPRWLAGREDKPPVSAVLLQGGIALVLITTTSLQQALKSIGAVLMLFSALTALSLFKVRFGKAQKDADPSRLPSWATLVAAGFFVAVSAGMLLFGFKEPNDPTIWIWVGAVILISALAHWMKVRRRPKAAGPG
jgi:basic amino acid/polyamine antiporter, APA family